MTWFQNATHSPEGATQHRDGRKAGRCARQLSVVVLLVVLIGSCRDSTAPDAVSSDAVSIDKTEDQPADSINAEALEEGDGPEYVNNAGHADDADHNDTATRPDGEAGGSGAQTPVGDPPGADSSADFALERSGSFRWIELAGHRVQLLWTDDANTPFGQMEVARQSLEADGWTVLAVANGGIYDTSLKPLGLHIEDGTELVPLNTKSGGGNFYLQPNGVFVIAESGFHLFTTEQFADGYSPGPQPSLSSPGNGPSMILHALQSGPMLLQDGTINELFTSGSQSRTIRTAIGIEGSGRAVLLMADRPVNMWELADQGRQLGLTDLLYLDGSVARLDNVTQGRRIFPNVPLAAMIAVVEIDG